MDTQTRLTRVKQQYKEILLLSGTTSLLDWDQQDYMPLQGAENRAEQQALIAALHHEKMTQAQFLEDLAELSASSDLAADDAVLVREVRRDAERAARVPAPLVRAISAAESGTHHKWVQARNEKRFSVVAASLRELIGLKIEYARVVQPDLRPYDALIDQYEPGFSEAKAAPLIGQVHSELRQLIQRVNAANRQGSAELPAGDYDPAAQEQLGRQITELMGYDYSRGRSDVTVHPFCTTIGPGDIRISLRYKPENLFSGLFAAMHEAGHAIYDQGFLPQYSYTPLGEPVSFGIHESQSLFWENHVGRSPAFWRYLFPRLQASFPDCLGGANSEAEYRAANKVEPSFIRVDADEVTYGLHIAVRFELERKLISGALSTSDLPEAWNAQYTNALGLTPPDDRIGVLQDVHWYMGSFGYFPSYLLGAMYAAQFAAAMHREMPDFDDNLARGELAPLKQWLNSKIHQHGKRYSAEELVERASGSKPSAVPLIEHLTQRCALLYGC